LEKINPVDQLVILLSFSSHSEQEKKEIKDLMDSICSWEELWHLAHENRIAPHVQKNLEKLRLFNKLPENIQKKFMTRSEEIKRINGARIVVARKFLKKFEENNVPVIILKGANFAETIYYNPYYRRMNDIDILIKREDLEKILDIYDEMDFFSLSELFGGDPRKVSNYSHHLQPVVSKDINCVIGTHWGLITPKAKYKYDYDAIWSRTFEFDYHKAKVLSMSYEDNLKHISVHLPYYKAGLKEIADIYNIVRDYGDRIHWDIFLEDVKKGGAEYPVYHAFSLCNKICPMDEFARIIDTVRPKCKRSEIIRTRKRIKYLDVVLRSRSTHMSRIEKPFNEFLKTKSFKEKWSKFFEIYKHMLFPPKEDIIKMNSFHRPNFIKILFGRFLTPLRIMREFVNDLGLSIFIMINIKNVFDVIACSIMAPFRSKDSVESLNNFAKRIGLTMDDLQRLKDSQE
jgi:hypothetical protein